MSYEFLQNYWWCLVALLGGLLVFLMFVQGIVLRIQDVGLYLVVTQFGQFGLYF